MKRKGIVARWGLNETGNKDASRWIRTDFGTYGVGRVGNDEVQTHQGISSMKLHR